MEKCIISSHTKNSSVIILTTNSDTANMIAVAGLVAIILVVFFVFLIKAVLRLLQPRPPNMSAPVEESLDQYGVFAQHPYNQLVVVGRSPQQPNVHLIHLVTCHNNHLMHSHLLPSIPSCYITLYLLVCGEQMPEDVPVQESIQCLTNEGKAVSVIGGKEYPPPAND